MMLPLLGSLAASPVAVLILSIALIVVLIAVCRVHAFFALIFAASAVALVTAGDGGAGKALDSVMSAFGAAVGGVGFPIALAAVIGAALMGSGSADKIVRDLVAVFGEKRAPIALLAGGFILSVPVFFDTVFFLLIPLARALSVRTGKNYILYVMAICAGGVITHSTVPPTPGPIVMAEMLHLDMGFVILAGLIAGILPAVGGLWFAAWKNKRSPVALRSIPGSTMEEVEAIAHRDEKELPGFLVSIAPVLVPVFLVTTASIVGRVAEDSSGSLVSAILFAGHKNVALLIGALIAVAVYLKRKGLSWRASEGVVGEPLGTAGVIILITAAGGAYGAMLRGTGIGEVLSTWAENHGIPILLLAWGFSALMRMAQGSTTVAVITTAGLMMAIGGEGGFGVHPILVFLAIGYGGIFMSWMNDSGFWLFCRMGGFTEGETLRSWSVLLCIISLIGLAEVLAVSMFMPAV